LNNPSIMVLEEFVTVLVLTSTKPLFVPWGPVNPVVNVIPVAPIAEGGPVNPEVAEGPVKPKVAEGPVYPEAINPVKPNDVGPV
jgi:hypothetical protein